MGFKYGQKVYTINAKTNAVDAWTYGGALHTAKGILYRLENGPKYCYLPARCVYETELGARFIADSYR